jgi:hypothetical protein
MRTYTMKRSSFHHGMRPWLLAGLLSCSLGAAQARGHWAVDLDIGWPIGLLAYGMATTVLPVGAVSVSYGGGRYWHHHGVWYRPWGARWVIVAPPVGIMVPVESATLTPEAAAPLALPAVMARPDPVIYPRNGQSAQQTETDRQECNRWATTQPVALADAMVFQRAVEACMDGRGYTLK